jgi:GAF domain-containing protein
MVMPILSRGAPTAMLMLLSQRGSGAFTTDREDIAQLLAGQLSVSLENTRLYAALERKVSEHTQAPLRASRR